MNKTWILLILVLFLTACTTPNPYAEDAIIAFCKSVDEGNVENALQLFTEDIKINFVPERTSNEAYHEGHSGVEELLDNFAEWEVFDCRVEGFEVKGDEVKFSWTHNWPGGVAANTASCECSGTMQGDKIHTIIFDCVYKLGGL
jgi:hypothetical protein